MSVDLKKGVGSKQTLSHSCHILGHAVVFGSPCGYFFLLGSFCLYRQDMVVAPDSQNSVSSWSRLRCRSASHLWRLVHPLATFQTG